MPVLVYKYGEKIVIENGSKIILDENQARYLLKKLADTLGYRINPVKPDVTFKLAGPGLIYIAIYEGKGQKTIVLPVDVIREYIAVLSQLGPGKHKKRLVANMVLTRLAGDERFKPALEKYIIDGKLDWEKFFGGREEYYTYFRAPILVLEKLGYVKELRSPYITVTEKIESENLPGFLRPRSN